MKKTIPYTLLYIFFYITIPASSQIQSKIDSVKQILYNTNSDSVRLYNYFALGELYEDTVSEVSIFFLNKTNKLADELLSGNDTTISKKSIDIVKIKVYKEIGDVYYKMYQYNNGIENYIKSIEIALSHNLAEMAASAYNRVARSYSSLGLFDQSIENYNKCLAIEQEIKNENGMSVCYKGIGNVYYSQGNNSKAIDYFKKSLKIEVLRDNKAGIAECYKYIGGSYYGHSRFCYDTKKRYEYVASSLEYLNKSLMIYKELDNERLVSSCYKMIAVVYQVADTPGTSLEVKVSHLDSTLKYLLSSKRIEEKYGNIKGLASTYRHIASAYSSLESAVKKGYQREGDFYRLAIENGLKSYELEHQLNDVWGEKSISKFMAGMYYKNADLEKAEKYFLEVLELDNINTLMNFSFSSEEEKEKFFVTVREDYMRFSSFAYNRRQTHPEVITHVYDYTLKNKGLLLKSSTAMRRAVTNSGDTALISKYEKWISIKKELAKLYSQSSEENEDVIDKEEQADRLEEELVKSSHLFSDFKKVQDITWKDVRNALKPGEAAIEFIDFRYKAFHRSGFSDTTFYCAMILKNNSLYPEFIPLFTSKELKKITGRTESSEMSYVNKLYGENGSGGNDLYNLVWKPLEDILADTKTIYLSPTGWLHKISFASLKNNQGMFLTDIYDLNIVNSTGILSLNNFRESAGLNLKKDFSVGLFGGIDYNGSNTKDIIWSYLQGTRNETDNIKSLLVKKRVTVNYFNSGNATETEFIKQAEENELVHVSTHGFFYPDPSTVKKETKETAPVVEKGEIAFRGGKNIGLASFVENENPLMRSGLVFASANDVWNNTENNRDEDGVLTAQEVLTIDMSSVKLIVLSACETGLGDVKGSEGVYGLQRAFKMAGVKYIIMSLWQVPDKETEEFMSTFYTKLVKYKDIKKSFNESQREMRKKYDPYFWGAFELIE